MKEVQKCLNSEDLKVVTENPANTAVELSEKFKVYHIAFLGQMKRIRKVLVIGKWVPNDLSPENLQQRVDCCESLLTQVQVLGSGPASY